jgi:hypothetical protein
MTVPQTIEDLEKALSIPSFEEELAQSELPHKSSNLQKSASAYYVVCPICGARVLVGPYDEFRCPNAPHDIEDDNSLAMGEPIHLDDIEDEEIVI